MVFGVVPRLERWDGELCQQRSNGCIDAINAMDVMWMLDGETGAGWGDDTESCSKTLSVVDHTRR